MRRFFCSIIFFLSISFISIAGTKFKNQKYTVFGVRGNVEQSTKPDNWEVVFDGEKILATASFRLSGKYAYLSIIGNQSGSIIELKEEGTYTSTDIDALIGQSVSPPLLEHTPGEFIKIWMGKYQLIPKNNAFKFTIYPFLSSQTGEFPCTYYSGEPFKIRWDSPWNNKDLKDKVVLQISTLENEVVFEQKLSALDSKECEVNLKNIKIHDSHVFISILDKTEGRNNHLSRLSLINIENSDELKSQYLMCNKLINSESLAVKLYGITYAIKCNLLSLAHEGILKIDKDISSYYGYKGLVRDLRKAFPL